MPPAAGGRPLLVALRALGLGDLLTAVPALRALRERFPEHRPVLAAPAPLAPLARLAAGFEVADTAPLAPLPQALHGADVAVNLHGRGPQSHRALLAARPRRALWFASPEVPESAGGPRWREEEHEVRRWCRLLAHYGLPADPRRLDLPAPRLPAPPGARGATLIHPGAASPARRWPPERWAAVARSEAASGRPVLVTGGPGEEALARRVASLAGLPPGSVLAGRTDLLQLAALVAAAGRVACGDTGVAHLATALFTPSVVLFGPTPPSRWGPPPERRLHRVLWAGTTGDPHGSSPDPGLLRIGVEEVLEALSDLPAAEPSVVRRVQPSGQFPRRGAKTG
ncbi:glycosyl transferase, family 9 [Rubrobacter xylanophilus DSM 9941]|uniref:Glycosyl transferase, family 9 n=1 Tax=Rubrobacter xylanophilus (strain DSM 9941 / JCM 11954 / NBRC 16129 / PRD-1) TaxID=266117 RepID=Q1AY48_RUBXD|nr:glycosyltransferase family 9 protein [Rubrobacter xylanophilus]ABG03680.1 glycosyl transferase, family 9 [Rubrobacter xylanophilus DSM 9941]